MQNQGYSFITPTSTFLSEDLLFFDTFSHSGSEKDNFDLVQFPSPVIIDWIKIVPLGQPVEAKIPGNVRLGATNPSKCELEFFINDLSKQDAHTMADLGKFYCSEKDTDFNPPLQIQTDGLLLRGSYRTLTLAIFGQIAAFEEKLDDEVLMSATSPPAQTPASPVASERDNPYILRDNNKPASVKLERVEPEEILLDDETARHSKGMSKSNILVEDASISDNAITDIADIAEPESETEPGVEIIKEDPIMIEEMSSSETGVPTANYSSRDKRLDDMEYSDSADIDNYAKRLLRGESLSRHTNSVDKSPDNDQHSEKSSSEEPEIKEWTFNIETYHPKPLAYFADPSLTLQERSILARELKLGTSHGQELDEREIEKVREMFDVLDCTDDLKTDDWVTLMEDLTNDLANMSLSQTVSNIEMLRFLVTQVCHGLDINLALKQKQTGFRVRHIRAGLKLTTIMFHCGKLAIEALLEADIPRRVIELYYGPQMSLPLRLLICKCLNAITDSVEGVNYLITHKCEWTHKNFTLSYVTKVAKSKYKSKSEAVDRDDRSTKFESVTSEENQDVKTAIKIKSSPKYPDEENDDDESVPEPMTCYQALILILLAQPTTRVTIALGNLIRKIRLYDNLSQLQLSNNEELDESEDSVFHSMSDVPLKANILDKNLVLLQDIVNLTKDGCTNIGQPARFLPAKLQFQVKHNPSDIYLAIFKWLKHFNTLYLLERILSVDCSESMTSSDQDVSNRLQGLCLVFIQQILNFPRGLQFLLSSECVKTSGSLIKTLAGKQHLKKTSHLRLSDGMGNCLSSPDCQDRLLTISSCHDFSIRMAYNFKVFSCIDKLFHFHRQVISKRGECSVSNPEKILHKLYIVSEHPYGLAAIVNHFSHIGNLDCLLRFLDMPLNNKQLEFVKETSIDYVLELVGMFLRLNNKVLEIADEYLDTLIELSKTKDKTLSAKIKSLISWLNPFDTDQPVPFITYSEDTFKQLTRVLRKSIPNYSIPFAKELNFELPPQMITAVRIMRQLCIPHQVESYVESTFNIFSLQKLVDQPNKSTNFVAFVDSLPHQQNQNHSWNLNLLSNRLSGFNHLSEDSMSEQLNQISNTFKLFQPYDDTICGELKHHYAIIQVYEQEGLRRLLNTLRELTGNYPRPVYQSAALSGFRGRIVISYINCVITLLHSIICHLIDARGSEFRDTSVIPVVLETYSLLCFVPSPQEDKSSRSIDASKQTSDINSLHKAITLRSDNYLLAQQTKKLIISILMSYTQMCLSVSESEEKVISKSIWTKMLKEVMDFTLSTPVFFHHGLDILTKILPSPLPCSSIMDSIDQEQLFKNINHRKLWSAHLHPLHQQIEQMISNLSISYQTNIRALLYYLCNQLCDLSSNAACMVAKIITDTLIMYASKLHQDTVNNGNTLAEHVGTQMLLQPALQTQTTRENANPTSSTVAKESAYAVKMILNLLSNLISNQAFETAFTNHLQMIGKKDEKLLGNLKETLIFYEDYKPGEQLEDLTNQSSSGACGTSAVSHLIESIKAVNIEPNKLADGYSSSVIEANPPEELTKINLIDLSRKISDRSFALHAGLTKTYRLKVLLDLNARAHRSNESSSSSSKRFDRTPFNYQEISVPSSHKSYVAPLRGRGRSAARPDSFRSRPQNTSRPPSIHVDDFVDLYGDAPGQGGRYPMMPMSGGTGSSGKAPEYRGASLNRPGAYPPPDLVGEAPLPPSIPRGLPYYGGSTSSARSGSPYSSSRSRSRSKHMK